MFSRLSLVSLLSFCALSALSVPLNGLAARQVGNLECNLDRLAVIKGLVQTTADVKNLAKVGSADPAVTNATTAALGGLKEADEGVATILKALFAGQNAPPAARDQVGDGLDTAFNALSTINSTDASVTAALSKAKTDLLKTGDAGNGVVENCK